MCKRSLFRGRVRGQGLVEMAIFAFFVVALVVCLYFVIDVECSYGIGPCCDIVNAVNSLLGIPPNPGLVDGPSCSFVPAVSAFAPSAGFLFWQ